MDPVLIGSRLRDARKAAGLTQEQLERLAGVSQPHISAIERGEAELPAMKALARLAGACRITVADLVAEEVSGD